MDISVWLCELNVELIDEFREFSSDAVIVVPDVALGDIDIVVSEAACASPVKMERRMPDKISLLSLTMLFPLQVFGLY